MNIAVERLDALFVRRIGGARQSEQRLAAEARFEDEDVFLGELGHQRELEGVFDGSRTAHRGQETLDACEILESAAELGLDSAEVRSYLTENLHFFLHADEIAGLEEFYRRAREHGLIPNLQPLKFRD